MSIFISILVISLISGETERIRTNFFRHGVSELEKEFHYSKFPTRRRCIEIARSTPFTESQIRNWFSSKRGRWRRKHFSAEVKLQLHEQLTTAPISSSNIIKKEEEEPKTDPT